MDILNLFAASGGGLSAFVLFGVMGMALTVFIAGAALALKANRSASESRLNLLEAESRLATASELAEEVRSLRAQVESAVVHHNNAVHNARLMHNEACGVELAKQDYAEEPEERHDFAEEHDERESVGFKGKQGDDHKKHHAALKGGKHDDHHKKHHAAFKGGKHDDDHKKHHAAFKGGKHDDEHHKHHKGGKHDDHKKRHADDDYDDGARRGFMGWFFDR